MTNTTQPAATLAPSDVKTIDINAKQWFDKVNGNSYFAAVVTLNYGMDNETSISLPFQYGYGEQYIHEAANELDKLGYINLEKYPNGSHEALWSYCSRNGIIKRNNKETGCKKRDLK